MVKRYNAIEDAFGDDNPFVWTIIGIVMIVVSVYVIADPDSFVVWMFIPYAEYALLAIGIVSTIIGLCYFVKAFRPRLKTKGKSIHKITAKDHKKK